MRCEQAPRCATAPSRMHFRCPPFSALALFFSLLHTPKGFPQDHVVVCAGEFSAPCSSRLCYDSIDVRVGRITSGCAESDMCSSPGCAFVENLFVCCCEHSACNGKSEGFIKARLRMWNSRRGDGETSREGAVNQTMDHFRLSVRNAPTLSSEMADSDELSDLDDDKAAASDSLQKAHESTDEASAAPHHDSDELITWGELRDNQADQSSASRTDDDKNDAASSHHSKQQSVTTKSNEKGENATTQSQRSDDENGSETKSTSKESRQSGEIKESSEQSDTPLADSSAFSEERNEGGLGNSTESSEEEEVEFTTVYAEESDLLTDQMQAFPTTEEETTVPSTKMLFPVETETLKTQTTSLRSFEFETSTTTSKFESADRQRFEKFETTTERIGTPGRTSTAARPRKERVYTATKMQSETVPQFGSERKPLVMEKGSIEAKSRHVDVEERPPVTTVPWWLVAFAGLLTAVLVCGVVYKLISRRSRGVTLPATGQEMTPLKRPNEEEGVRGNDA